MVLRKHLLNGIIYKIDQFDYDRYLFLYIRNKDELYDEKHFILSRELGGVDSAFSMDKDEFATMVQYIRQTSIALGSKKPHVDKHTMAKRRIFARSIFSSCLIKKGEILNKKNIAIVRPNNGLHPRFYKHIIGRKAKCDIPACKPLKRKYIKGI